MNFPLSKGRLSGADFPLGAAGDFKKALYPESQMEVINEQAINPRASRARKYPRPFTNNPFPEPPPSLKKPPSLHPPEKRLKSVAAPPTTYFNEQEFPDEHMHNHHSHSFALNPRSNKPFSVERSTHHVELDFSASPPPPRLSDPTTAASSSRHSILSPKEKLKQKPLQWKRTSYGENSAAVESSAPRRDRLQKVFSLSPVSKISPSPSESDPSALDFMRTSPEGRGALPYLKDRPGGPSLGGIPTTSRLESGQIADLRKQAQKGHNSQMIRSSANKEVYEEKNASAVKRFSFLKNPQKDGAIKYNYPKLGSAKSRQESQDALNSAVNSSEEKSHEDNSLRKGNKYDNILIYQNMTDHKQYLIRNLFYQSQNNQNHSQSYDTPDSSFNASRSGAGVAQNLAQKFRNAIDREYSPKRPRREYLGHPPPDSPSKPPNTEITFDQQIYIDDQKTKIRGPKEILKVFSPNKRPRRGNRSQDPVREEQGEFEFAPPEPL